MKLWAIIFNIIKMFKLLTVNLFYIPNSEWERKMLISIVIENYEEDKSLSTNKEFTKVSKINWFWDQSEVNDYLKE